jgi:DNA polymerase-3 subunit delta
MDEVSAAPFIATKRLVIVQGLPKWSKDDVKALIACVHPASVLVICDSKPDKRLAGYKELLATATVKEFAPLTGKLLSDWLQKESKQAGAPIAADASSLLLGIVGNDQEMLSQEIHKLAVTATEKITADHVQKLAVPSGEQEIWHLMNLLARGDLSLTLGYARSLLRSGEDPFSLWNMLLWMLRCLVSVTLCASEGERNPARIASSAGVPFPTAKTLLPLAEKIDRAQIRSILNWAVTADRALKTGGYRATAEAPQELIGLIESLLIRAVRLTRTGTRLPSA